MSHDRGCSCGREGIAEYRDCPLLKPGSAGYCIKASLLEYKDLESMVLAPPARVRKLKTEDVEALHARGMLAFKELNDAFHKARGVLTQLGDLLHELKADEEQHKNRKRK